jgi:hypothetical protein
LPDEPAAAKAYAPVERLPQTTADYRKRLPQTTANPEVRGQFAVVDSLISDEDLDDDLDLFRDVDANDWRIERRYRVNQDVHKVMYFNYRRRKIKRVKGKQRVEYRKGGSRIVS